MIRPAGPTSRSRATQNNTIRDDDDDFASYFDIPVVGVFP
jgi:hypothetical protein